jgi:hypothetical protein
MDCGAEYILMCEKAKEIQDIWHNATLRMLPSILYDKEIDRVVICIWTPKTLANRLGITGNSIRVSIESTRDMSHFTPEADIPYDTLVWLPRQDQLQEMVEYPDLGSILRDVREFWMLNSSYHPIDFTSMEQLWLAFVMKEKFDKVWNGEGWEGGKK